MPEPPGRGALLKMKVLEPDLCDRGWAEAMNGERPLVSELKDLTAARLTMRVPVRRNAFKVTAVVN